MSSREKFCSYCKLYTQPRQTKSKQCFLLSMKDVAWGPGLSSLNKSGILTTTGEYPSSASCQRSCWMLGEDRTLFRALGRERFEGDLIACLGESKCPFKVKKSREIGL